jgi:hypothetical protein
MPYSERYVAYIDILGFSEIIKRSETNPRLYEELVKKLSEIQAREPIEGEEAIDFQFQTFSDSIVVSVSSELRGLAYLLNAIYIFALDLMQESLLIRGAIAKGKLYHKKGVMFGPAFIEAYRLEQTVAKYPRVVLSKQTYEDHKASTLEPLTITLSEDGPPCVSIFEPLEMFLGKDDARIKATEIATRCRIAIQGLLNDSIHSPSHYEKLRWLAIEWNKTISKRQNRIIFPLDVEFRQRNQLPDETE